MSRGSFGRTVARAAASGGSKSYRARPPMLWYLSIVLIVVVGVALIVYSRNEAQHRASASATASGPTKSDNWYTALAFDVCGTLQPRLPANTNIATAGIRTFGDGIVNTNPGAVKDSAKFTGAHATLGTFVSTYGQKLVVSSKLLQLPGTPPKRYVSGTRCTSGPDKGKTATVQVMTWKNATASGTLSSGSPSAIRLRDGEMITVAFVPPGATIKAPGSRQTLLQDLGKK